MNLHHTHIHKAFTFAKTYKISVSVSAVVLIFMTLAFAFGGSDTKNTRPVVAVTTAYAEHADISGTRIFTGVLEANASTDLGAKASGRVTGLYADVGTRVGAGQLLVALDASTERATAESLRANADAVQRSIDAVTSLYTERIAGEEAPASAADVGGVGATTGAYATVTQTAALADQVNDTLGALLSVRGGVRVGEQTIPENILGVRDSTSKNAARDELQRFQLQNAEYQAYFDAQILNKNSDAATMDEAVARSTKILAAAKSVLNSSYTVLLNTTEGSAYAGDVQTYKTSVTTLGMQAEGLLKNFHDVTTGVSVLKKERDTKLSDAQAQLVMLKGQTAVADAMVSNSTVRAPFGGVITAKYTERGAVVAPGLPLLAIADDSTLKLVIGVPDTIAPSFHVGDTADVTIDGVEGEKLTARISKINPVVDSNSRKVTIELAIQNYDHALKVGSFARAAFMLEHAEGTTVPVGAVVARYGTEYVFVVRDGRVVRRTVMTGNRTETMIEIIDGIAEGDMVVTSGNAYLRDGDTVIVK